MRWQRINQMDIIDMEDGRRVVIQLTSAPYPRLLASAWSATKELTGVATLGNTEILPADGHELSALLDTLSVHDAPEAQRLFRDAARRSLVAVAS